MGLASKAMKAYLTAVDTWAMFVSVRRDVTYSTAVDASRPFELLSQPCIDARVIKASEILLDRDVNDYGYVSTLTCNAHALALASGYTSYIFVADFRAFRMFCQELVTSRMHHSDGELAYPQ